MRSPAELKVRLKLVFRTGAEQGRGIGLKDSGYLGTAFSVHSSERTVRPDGLIHPRCALSSQPHIKGIILLSSSRKLGVRSFRKRAEVDVIRILNRALS